MSSAVVTGGSRGFGRALAIELCRRGWNVVITGRTRATLEATAAQIPTGVTIIEGDVADPVHRGQVAEAVGRGLDLLVNNASRLGPSPLPPLAELSAQEFGEILDVNVTAPLGLTQALLPALKRRSGVIVNLSSDAAVEAYPGWGGYGASKAALDQLSAVLAAEHPRLRIYAFDPGDMRTDMHQAAFPGEDISDRPLPATVVPALLELLRLAPPSGRYSAADFMAHAE